MEMKNYLTVKGSEGKPLRSVIFASISMILLYILLCGSPYRMELKHFKRIGQCGVQHVIDDFSHGYYGRAPMSPLSIHNLTREELMDRKNALDIKRSKYQWGEPEDYKGFPPSILEFESVKCEEDFTIPYSMSFFGNVRKVVWEIMASKFLNDYTDIKNFELIFKSPFMDKPIIADRWEEDKTFSRMRLQGVNPVVIQKISEIPPHFEVDLGRIAEFIDDDVSVMEALAQGRFFLETYPDLVDLPTKNGVVFPAMCLHYVRLDSALVPVAIQLTQTLTEDDTLGVFYPDEGEAWTFAKLAANEATALHHQIVTHLLRTHLHVEVWSIASHRTLPEQHPIYLLMKDFLEKVIAINHQARILLLPKIIDLVAATGVPGSRVLAERAYDGFNFTEAYLKTDLINRGVWDPSLPLDEQPLKGYDYRDFALPLWDVFETYVRDIVHTFYINDIAVSTDLSIQSWTREIAVEGKMKGFPLAINSRSQLIEVVTSIMFTSSVQHAAINFNQYDMLGYVPNLPLSLNIHSMPERKDQFTREFLHQALPDWKRSTLQTAVVWCLSAGPVWSSDTIMHPTGWNHEEAQQITHKFVSSLQKISDQQSAINDARVISERYTVLDPKTIPKATAI